MPCGGTETEVTLKKKGGNETLRRVHIMSGICPQIFDLTGLPDGDYIADMLACSFGGPVEFSLNSKN
jgi:hypothetical protein